MERDMATTIATKADLQLLRQEMSLLATKAELAEVRQEVVLVRRDLEVMAAGFRKDLELLSSTMTVRLGSMLMLGLGLLFAALKLTA
jgi:hypothetical protein